MATTVIRHLKSGAATLIIGSLLVLSGCSTALVDERAAYWRVETKEGLPIGTPLQDAKNFFASRGLELRCCVSSPPEIVNAYMASERKVGRSLFIEYDVAILVTLSSDQKVEKVLLHRIGVGF